MAVVSFFSDGLGEGCKVQISIVIPTYNRLRCVFDAIDSALVWAQALGDCEVIVVDDASTDDTLAQLRSRYADELARSYLKVVALPCNQGVTGAKNAGAMAASGHWIVFLDSDDLLIAAAAGPVAATLHAYKDTAIIMFRCVDQASGALLGSAQAQDILVDQETYLNDWPYGECLPVVRRDAFVASPYDADLRGFEGLAYLRLLARHGPMLVSPVEARRYETRGDDRLSAPKVFSARARLLARGHTRILRENWRCFRPAGLVRQIGKLIYYTLRSQIVR